MALQPVSGVTPLRTTNLTFSGRRSNDEVNDSIYSRIPAQVKAVPVIVLMAMSPLNKINATESVYDVPETNDIEYVKLVENNKPTTLNTYDVIENGNKYYTVKTLSFDDNKNTYEGIEVIKYFDSKGNIVSRMMLTFFAPMKGSSGAPLLYIHGFKLPVDDLDDYTPDRGFHMETKSQSNNSAAREPLTKLLLKLCNDTERNNGAISMGTRPNDPNRARTGTSVRRNLTNLIGNND